MTSPRKRIQFSEILRGEGHEATCTGHVTVVKSRVTGDLAYTGYSIENVSKALPDGIYELTAANGETIRFRHQGKEWLPL
jgi:hypothetical protein